MSTWEGFYGQVDPLMSLQIVISVERLRTLITLEWTIILLLLVPWMAHVHVQEVAALIVAGSQKRVISYSGADQL